MLPIGVSDFNALIDSLLDDPTCPTKDRDSVVFAVSSIIMHSGPETDEIPVEKFLKQLRAGAAKQVAHSMFMEVKQKQQDAVKKAEEDAKKASDIDNRSSVSSPQG
jgi:hypothetical protein